MNQNILYDLVNICGPLIIFLGGTTEEKLLSIYKLYDKDEKDLLFKYELFSFIYNLLKFLFLINNALNIKEINFIEK